MTFWKYFENSHLPTPSFPSVVSARILQRLRKGGWRGGSIVVWWVNILSWSSAFTTDTPRGVHAQIRTPPLSCASSTYTNIVNVSVIISDLLWKKSDFYLIKVPAACVKMACDSKCCYDSAYCDCMPGINPSFREYRFIEALRTPPHARTVQVR